VIDRDGERQALAPLIARVDDADRDSVAVEPPLFPGLIAASVWTIVTPLTSRRPLTMPRLTVF